ncbi:MAG: DNA polymerase III subunit [Chloroflexi bacterium]|nr:DNA polymerase III subunit [Chloroflexota bacterium]
MPWTVFADDRVVRYLDASLRRGRRSHAYLLSGPPGVGVLPLAKQLAQALLCIGDEPPCGSCRHCRRVASGAHADVTIIEPGGPSVTISIDDVRQAQSTAALQSYEGRGKVFIFHSVERLTTFAANALLKLLEEPPNQVTLLLTSADEEGVPATVRSRCQTLRLRPLPFQRIVTALREEGIAEQDVFRLARHAAGRLEIALALAKDPALIAARREALDELVNLVVSPATDRLRWAESRAESFYRLPDGVMALLDTWESLCRDAVLVAAAAEEGLGDPTMEPDLRILAVSAEEGWRSGVAVRQTIEMLQRNVNARLALEALLLALPYRQRPPEPDPE